MGQHFDRNERVEANISFLVNLMHDKRTLIMCHICKFDFDELCRKDLGAADYNVLAKFYHTIFITNLKMMSCIRGQKIYHMYNLRIKNSSHTTCRSNKDYSYHQNTMMTRLVFKIYQTQSLEQTTKR